MSDLTADRRQGQVSSREKAMREINWKEVARLRKERQQQALAADLKKKPRNSNEKDEEDAAEDENAEQYEDNANASPTAEDNDNNEDNNEDNDDNNSTTSEPFLIGPPTTTTHTGPTLRLIDGRLVVDETTALIDRHAAAHLPSTTLETLTEDDLTTHLTQHSFLAANRRDPADRHPTPNDRWRDEDTERFYAALAMFGTDFALLARMFPGRTRRNIKHKFTREERTNPARVKAALVGQTKPPLELGTYLRETEQTEDELLDPAALREELEAVSREMEPEIEKARKETAEVERMRRIAEGGGVGREEEKGEGKKKGRRKKRNEPRGGEEVEIIGTIEDGLCG